MLFRSTFPLIADTTEISAPVTNPRFARNLLVSSFPPIFWIVFSSPIPAIVSGIMVSTLLSVMIIFFVKKIHSLRLLPFSVS